MTLDDLHTWVKRSAAYDAFKALDRAGQMAGAGLVRPPRVGSFGVKTVNALKKVANHENWHTDPHAPPSPSVYYPQSSKTVDMGTPEGSFEGALNEYLIHTRHPRQSMTPAKWKAAPKILGASIAGTTIGFALGSEIMYQLGKRLDNKPLPAAVRYAPMALAALGSGTAWAMKAVSDQKNDLYMEAEAKHQEELRRKQHEAMFNERLLSKRPAPVTPKPEG